MASEPYRASKEPQRSGRTKVQLIGGRELTSGYQLHYLVIYHRIIRHAITQLIQDLKLPQYINYYLCDILPYIGSI